MTAPVVRLRDVRFAYGERDGFVLDVPELAIGRGEHIACIGPSGSGKTTLISLMTGIVTPRTGEIELGGVRLTDLSESRRRAERIRRVGLVFQEFALLDALSARENLLLPYHASPALRLTADVETRADVLAETLGIAAVLHRRPSRLSQGERQRVAIGRALVTQPELVVCDEPTGNLDPDATSTVIELLLREVGARDATLLVVTHDHGLLDRFDRVIDMCDMCASAEEPA